MPSSRLVSEQASSSWMVRLVWEGPSCTHVKKSVACPLASTDLMIRSGTVAGTMWVHNPRAALMRAVLDDSKALGTLRSVTTSFAFSGRPCLLT